MAKFEIECKLCGSMLRTEDVTQVIAFDAEHTAKHDPAATQAGPR